MATELYRNDYMTATLDGELVTLHWDREEPDDGHAVGTARAVTQALDDHLKAHPGERFGVLVDLLVVKKTFPRATATYTAWLLGHRGTLRGGAFVTKSILLRASVAAALIVPGLTMKGFSSLEEARVFLSHLPH